MSKKDFPWDEFLQDVRDANHKEAKHLIKQAAYRVAQYINSGWVSRNEILEKLLPLACSHGMEEKQAVSIIRTGIRDGSKRPRHKDVKVVTEGSILPDDIEYVLKGKYLFRFNQVTNRVEMLVEGDNEWKVCEDSDLSYLRVELYSIFRKPVHERLLKDVIIGRLAIFYDPFKDYFDNLPQWDGVIDYIKQLADTVKVSNKQEDIWYRYLRRWLIAKVATMLNDNSNCLSNVNQSCLILVGAQGTGKTTWLNRLEIDPLYRYTGYIDPRNKDHMTLLSSRDLINMDELDVSLKADWASIKSMITMSKVSVRLPYASRSSELPRRASFCGSANNREVLGDMTGNRRFLIVQVDDVDYQFDENIIPGAYAQAYSLFLAGEKCWFDGDEIQQINAVNEQFQKETREEVYLDKYICKPQYQHEGEWLSATEICDMIDNIFGRDMKLSAQKVGILLGNRGFSNKHMRRNGSKLRRWHVQIVDSSTPVVVDENDEDQVI